MDLCVSEESEEESQNNSQIIFDKLRKIRHNEKVTRKR